MKANTAFAGSFAKLARAEADMVCEGGVSFGDLNAFVVRSFTDGQVAQRITEKNLAAKRQREAEAEAAAKQAADEKKAAQEAERAAAAEARAQAAQQVNETPAQA